MRSRIFLCIAACLLQWPLWAQMTVKADKQRIAPGEPLRLQVTITAPSPLTALIPDTSGAFEVISRLPADTLRKGNAYTTEQQFIMTAFDSGKFTLPPVTAPGLSPVMADSILVQPMPADSLNGYAPVKSYFTTPPFSQRTVQMALLASALCSAVLLSILLRRFRKVKKQFKPIRLSTPEAWQQQMQQLQQDWERGTLLPHAAAGQLMLMMREMLNLRGVDVTALTGEEMVQRASGLLPSLEWEQTALTVSLCYSMMFAKYHPGKDEFSQALTQVQHAGTLLMLPLKTTTNHA